MKRLFYWGLPLLFLIPAYASAFLSDSDPQNFFVLLERAPVVLVAQVKQSQKPVGSQRYYLHELRVKEVLAGNEIPDSPKVLQELIFLNEAALYPADLTFIAFLAPLPPYTAFAAAREQGAAFRSFGALAGILVPAEENRQGIVSLAKQWIALKSSGGPEADSFRMELMLIALESPELPVRDAAARRLSELTLRRGLFTIEDYKKIEAALTAGNLKPEAQQSLVTVIEKAGDAGALDSLRRIAGGTPSPSKWAAVRSLERLGIQRSFAELREDFSIGKVADKNRIVGMLVQRKTPEARDFLKGLLGSAEDLNVKREVLDQMARVGGAEYEAILIEQTQNRDEQVAMQAIVALGSLPTDAALQKIISLLDNPSPLLRGAAGMALMRCPDPRAAKIYRVRFEEQGYGHFHR